MLASVNSQLLAETTTMPLPFSSLFFQSHGMGLPPRATTIVLE